MKQKKAELSDQKLAQNLFCGEDAPITILLFDYRKDETEIFYHSHDFYELVVVLNGVGIHQTAQGEQKISVGDTFLIRPGEGHSYRSLRQLKIANILYQPERFKSGLKAFREGNDNIFPEFNPFLTASGNDRILTFSGDMFQVAGGLVQRMAMEQQTRHIGSAAMLQLLFLELLMLIYRSGRKKLAAQTEIPEKIVKLQTYMEEHYHRRITLAELARQVSISVPSVNRLWRENLQCSPMAYLMRLRLDKAEQLLRETRLPLSEVAGRTGFCDSNYLAKCFRRHFQETPRRHRIQYRPQP